MPAATTSGRSGWPAATGSAPTSSTRRRSTPTSSGVIYAVAGHDLLAVRIVQAVIGSLSAVLVAWAAARLFSTRAGIIAGALLALWAPAIFFDGLIQKSVLDVAFVSAAVALIAAIVTGGHDRRGAVAGARARPPRASASPARTRWCSSPCSARGRRRRAAPGGWAAPARWRPSPSASRWCSARSSSATTPSAAACTSPPRSSGPTSTSATTPAPTAATRRCASAAGSPEFERLDATELAERAAGRPLTPAEVSSYWTSRALDFIRGDPGAWLRLEARKAALLVNAAEMIDTESQESHAEWSWPLRLLGPLTHFGVLVPLAVVGLWLTWPDRRRLWVLYAIAATFAITTVAFYVFARYRFPLVPLLVLFAAAGVARIAAEWRTLAAARRIATLAGVVVGDGGDLPVAGDLDRAGAGHHRDQPRHGAARRRPTRRGGGALPAGARDRPRLRAGVQQPRRDAARAGPRRRRDSRLSATGCGCATTIPICTTTWPTRCWRRTAPTRRPRTSAAPPPASRLGRRAEQPGHRAGREGAAGRGRGGVRAGAGARADLGAGAPESRQRAGDAGPAGRTRSATCGAP